jgi:hypothetical protein
MLVVASTHHFGGFVSSLAAAKSESDFIRSSANVTMIQRRKHVGAGL